MKQEKTFSQTMKELLEQKEEGFWDKIKNALGSIGNWVKSFQENFSDLDKPNHSKKILIIDEIDVLFDRNYYGNTYDLAVSLQHDSIRKLLEFIWKNKSSPALGPKFIKDSQ